MNILRQAMEAVQRNLVALAIYLGISVGANLVGYVTNLLMGGPFDELQPMTPALVAYEIGNMVFLVICYAVACSIAFSRFGQQIDRPLWKISGDIEALKRYFPMWFALQMLSAILSLASGFAGTCDYLDLALCLRYTWLGVAALITPVGACLMFRGKITRDQFKGSFRPFWRQFPHTLVILLFSGLVSIFTFLLIVETWGQMWLRPAIDIVWGYFDCVVFCAMWIVCIIDRQNPEDEDLDF